MDPIYRCIFHTAEIELLGETPSDDASSFTAGLWLDFENVKLRGAITTFEEGDSRTASGGLLYQVQYNFVVGAEFELLLEDETDGFGVSVHFGRSF